MRITRIITQLFFYSLSCVSFLGDVVRVSVFFSFSYGFCARESRFLYIYSWVIGGRDEGVKKLRPVQMYNSQKRVKIERNGEFEWVSGYLVYRFCGTVCLHGGRIHFMQLKLFMENMPPRYIGKSQVCVYIGWCLREQCALNQCRIIATFITFNVIERCQVAAIVGPWWFLVQRWMATATVCTQDIHVHTTVGWLWGGAARRGTQCGVAGAIASFCFATALYCNFMYTVNIILWRVQHW